MQTSTFSNASWSEFDDDDAQTVVVGRDLSSLAPRAPGADAVATRPMVAQPADWQGKSVEDDDDGGPPTQRCIEPTPSGPARPFIKTVLGSGVHNLAAEAIADDPSPLPWIAEALPSPKRAELSSSPLPPLLSMAPRSRAEVTPVPAPRPRVSRPFLPPRPPVAASELASNAGNATPPPMSIELPSGVREQLGRELMGGPASVLRGRNRASAFLAAASLLLTLILGVVLLVPRTGQIRIAPSIMRGTVAHAEVMVDGAKRCDTVPCVVSDLSPGAHTVVVRAEGYRAEPAVQTVAAGKERLALIPLRPEVVPAGVRAASEVAGVRVRVDGVDRGPLPAHLSDLAPGEHRIRFEGPGYPAVEHIVSLKAGETRDFGTLHSPR